MILPSTAPRAHTSVKVMFMQSHGVPQHARRKEDVVVPHSSRVKTKAARILAIALWSALFALPVVYLGAFRAAASTVLASEAPRVQAPTGSPDKQDVVALEAAVRATPTPANRLNLSLAYIQTNRPEQAIPILLSLVAEDKDNALAWNNLCVANTLRHSYAVASEDCSRAIVLEPNNQLARNNLKWTEDEQNKAMLALADQQRAPPASHDTAFYIAEGLSQLNAGHPDAAIVSWQRVLELDPENALAANNIGDAYMIKKLPGTALEWFQKASTMDPTMQCARNNMAWARTEISKAK